MNSPYGPQICSVCNTLFSRDASFYWYTIAITAAPTDPNSYRQPATQYFYSCATCFSYQHLRKLKVKAYYEADAWKWWCIRKGHQLLSLISYIRRLLR